MANELTLGINFAFVKGGIDHRFNESFNADVSGNAYIDNVQEIDTSEEAVQLGDIATPGFVFVHNLDSTNYVEIGAAAAEYCIKLGPGQRALFPLNGTTLFAKANTAACNVRFLTVST